MRKIQAFAMIEAAISLLIMGIAVSVSIMQFKTIVNTMRIFTTKEHCHIVFHAIGSYYIKHHTMPTPENLHGDFGYVPFMQLQMMEKYSYDGYGNKLLYSTGSIEYPNAFIIIKSVNKNGQTQYIDWYSKDLFFSLFQIQTAIHTPHIQEDIFELDDNFK